MRLGRLPMLEGVEDGVVRNQTAQGLVQLQRQARNMQLVKNVSRVQKSRLVM